MIREINYNDFDGLLTLYMQLHDNPFPQKSDDVMKVWNSIVDNENYHIVVAEEGGKIVSSCTCVIIPNLTHNQRPYAFVENVITDKNYRGKGYATKLLDYVKSIAQQGNCYKIMLMTGSRLDSTLKFYESAGYNQVDKIAFITWL